MKVLVDSSFIASPPRRPRIAYRGRFSFYSLPLPPIVQWLEHSPYKGQMQVRLLLGGPCVIITLWVMTQTQQLVIIS